MLKWIPLTLGMTALVLSGCGQQADRYEPETLPEPELVLPEPPPMEPVEVEPAPAPEPEPVAAPQPEPRPEPKPEPKFEPNYGIVKDGPYVLQIALSNQKRSIDALAERLRKDGFPAYVTTVENPTPELQGTYYRVRIGAFANTRTAREYGRRNLEPQGISFWVDLKARDSEPVHQVIEAKPKEEPKKEEPKAEAESEAKSEKPKEEAVKEEARTTDEEPELSPAVKAPEPEPAPAPAGEAESSTPASLPDW